MTDVRPGTRLRVEVARYPEDPPRPARWPYPVVALGNFDGLHRGHQKILERVCRQAREKHGTPLVMTFDPHPPRVLRPDKAPPLLMTSAQRIEALARAGMEGVALVRFDMDLARLDPDTFVRRVLVEWLGVAEVWVGGSAVGDSVWTVSIVGVGEGSSWAPTGGDWRGNVRGTSRAHRPKATRCRNIGADWPPQQEDRTIYT
ncbi:MAG TPA: hypothetical protein DCQ94_05590 [Nitrospira sp.]|nr:hypothetical protein [Nitrospira sp.]